MVSSPQRAARGFWHRALQHRQRIDRLCDRPQGNADRLALRRLRRNPGLECRAGPLQFDDALNSDDGVSVLRIYETGRILVFSDKLSGGSADAYRDQEAEPLVVKKATKEQAETEAELLGRRLRRAGAPELAISLDAPRLSADAAAWSAMADAIAVTGATLAEMLTSPIARECPSSDGLRPIRHFENGGSGSSGVRV